MTNTISHKPVELSAGPLVMTFDPGTAMLRHVRLGSIELIRGVFAAVRDRDWNTIPFSLDEFDVRQSPDRFELSFVAKCIQSEIEFEWRGTVTGTVAGLVRYDFHGFAKSTFLRNRIGLCVLHPIKECVGCPCTIGHSDGSTTSSKFPKWISPHQPFKDVRSITHSVADQLDVKVTFDGEVFETEDQRNWTDASYKTYGTPLELPFPVEIEEGSHVSQSVTIELVGETHSTHRFKHVIGESKAEADVLVHWDDARSVPPVGLSMSTCAQLPSDAVVQRLREIRPSHLRVDVRLKRGDWSDDLHRAIDLATRIGTKLEIATFSDDIVGQAWDQCQNELLDYSDSIARWLVFHSTAKSTPDRMTETALTSIRNLFAELPVAVGTDAYFAELNRNRPCVPEGCLVCYSINPQVHAFDKMSLCETLEAQAWTVDSAHQQFNAAVIVSPITLRPRFNPNATSVAEDETITEPDTDARQATGFVAAWTVGVLAQLASHRKMAGLTFYETFGPRGIMSATGQAYPVASVFNAIRDVRSVFPTTSKTPREVSAIGLQHESGVCNVLLSNMSNQPKTICVANRQGRRMEFSLDGESIRVVDLESQP